MSRLEKPRTRAIVVTALVMAAVCLLLPSIMAVIGAWNDNLASSRGKNYIMSDKNDLLIVDPTEETDWDGEVLQNIEENGTYYKDMVEVTYGNGSASAYNTIDPIDCSESEAGTDNAYWIFALNVSTVNFRENDTYSVTLQVRGLEDDCVLNTAVWVVGSAHNKTAYASGHQLGATNSTETMASSSTTGAFTTMTVEFTYYDLIHTEDDQERDNNIYVAFKAITNETVDGAFLDFRLWSNCPISSVYIAQEDAIQFSYGTVGIVLLVFGLFATPYINLTPGVGVRHEIKHHMKNSFDRHAGNSSYSKPASDYPQRNNGGGYNRPRRKFGRR